MRPQLPPVPVRLAAWSGMLALLPFALAGCLMDWLGFPEPPQLRVALAVYALDGLNSPYDDYNPVALPEPFSLDVPIVFASNAASGGVHFDIEAGRLQVRQEPYRGEPQDLPPPPQIISERLGRFATIPASPHNETAPLLLAPPGAAAPKGGVWMFASDREGRRDLYFVGADGVPRPFFGNDPNAEEAYASYDFERHELYFSSNRSGRFQIYRYRNLSRDTDFTAWLGNSALAALIEPVAELQSTANDTCPFVADGMLVFASDRPGGRGGYDLYASLYQNGGWGRPRSLQSFLPDSVRLNTPANEFRPTLFRLDSGQRTQRVLLFSSDRPGGKGGYDLYFGAMPIQDGKG